MDQVRVRIVGRGRAGGALYRALSGAASMHLAPSLGRDDTLRTAGDGVDILILAVSDSAIAEVAHLVGPHPNTVVAHLSGATSLEALAPHVRRASLHPLVAISDVVRGAEQLQGAWMAIAGDPLIELVANALHARIVRVADSDRARYHATAAMASNHLVALLGQVERVAASVGVPLEAYLELAEGALANIRRLGAAAALTGPVSREDWKTVRAHMDALPVQEREAYLALARQAAILAGRTFPADLT